jgi:hypothetical protein
MPKAIIIIRKDKGYCPAATRRGKKAKTIASTPSKNKKLPANVAPPNRKNPPAPMPVHAAVSRKVLREPRLRWTLRVCVVA